MNNFVVCWNDCSHTNTSFQCLKLSHYRFYSAATATATATILEVPMTAAVMTSTTKADTKAKI
jgi:hypothetical protein